MAAEVLMIGPRGAQVRVRLSDVAVYEAKGYRLQGSPPRREPVPAAEPAPVESVAQAAPPDPPPAPGPLIICPAFEPEPAAEASPETSPDDDGPTEDEADADDFDGFSWPE